jgi:hypothetical protein
MHKTNYTCIIQEMISVEAQTLKLEKALKTTCNKNTELVYKHVHETYMLNG